MNGSANGLLQFTNPCFKGVDFDAFWRNSRHITQGIETRDSDPPTSILSINLLL